MDAKPAVAVDVTVTALILAREATDASFSVYVMTHGPAVI